MPLQSPPYPVPPGAVYFAYNGYTFPTYIKTKLSETPNWSGDGRVIKHSTLTISATGWITQDDLFVPGFTIDAQMQVIRLILQAPGGRLTYINKGYDLLLDVNAPGGAQKDVLFGPKPGAFKWWPLGGSPNGCMGAGFSWEITVTLPECQNAVYSPGAGVFSEVSFSVQFETDAAGLLTRTINFKAEIPASLNTRGGLDAAANIDAWIGQLFRLEKP